MLMFSTHLFTYLFIYSPIVLLKVFSGESLSYSSEWKFGKSYNFFASS